MDGPHDHTELKTPRADRCSQPRALDAGFRRLSILPLVLSLIAGSTDTIGFLRLNGFFTAHITGNLVVLAAHVINRDPAILSYVLAVPVFALVLLSTRMLATFLERAGTAILPTLLLLELLLLVGFLACCVTCGPGLGASSGIAIIAGMFGVSAMAVQTALVQISLTESPSTAVMTTNIAYFMLALGEILTGRDHAVIAGARKRATHIFPVILGFAAGSALGAAGESVYGSWSLVLPAGLATLAVAMSVIVRH